MHTVTLYKVIKEEVSVCSADSISISKFDVVQNVVGTNECVTAKQIDIPIKKFGFYRSGLRYYRYIAIDPYLEEILEIEVNRINELKSKLDKVRAAGIRQRIKWMLTGIKI